MIQIFHNSRCGKSRVALEFLKNSGNDFKIINYLQVVPSREELTKIIEKLKIQPIDLVRKKEAVWLENYKGKQLSYNQIIDALIQYPILIERPIIITKEKAIIARTPESFDLIF
jgi:arsenate reductase (glutaredoxin)